ncbi:WcbI family polysaccharide biosynthesis putative acetyltransferase [Roseomonas gilardii subsp. gilardii]|uniref:WcbI family polysaccharide biosynthesis putative acetyltransferase n=1 Tax=Roseomonas gilardii TaxID=257708 RepID=UPI001FF78132|nr:WcbI family polysaccharide biosynthesis putative acetyltransferase [Roseomonas gilardii]UPG72584.1 WcbI family polysaccharide biosynthesis putative acetyltransferase [Roseomonas gilardii subsp. gilardii]
MSEARARLVIGANCQGQEMAEVLGRIPSLAERFDVIHVGYHTLDRAEAGWDSYPDFRDAPALLWEQVFDNAFVEERAALRGRMPEGTPVLRFPPQNITALWPFEALDPRKGGPEDGAYPEGERYRLGDRIAMMLSVDGEAIALPDDALFDLYLERCATELPRLDRRLGFDLARAEARDKDSDIALAPFVAGRFREERLFHDYMHIAAPLLREILRQMLEASAGLLEIDAAQAQAEIQGLTESYRGQHFAQIPVNPLVARHFGLRWHDPAERVLVNASALSFRDYIVDYIRWRPYFT